MKFLTYTLSNKDEDTGAISFHYCSGKKRSCRTRKKRLMGKDVSTRNAKKYSIDCNLGTAGAIRKAAKEKA